MTRPLQRYNCISCNRPLKPQPTNAVPGAHILLACSRQAQKGPPRHPARYSHFPLVFLSSRALSLSLSFFLFLFLALPLLPSTKEGPRPVAYVPKRSSSAVPISRSGDSIIDVTDFSKSKRAAGGATPSLPRAPGASSPKRSVLDVSRLLCTILIESCFFSSWHSLRHLFIHQMPPAKS